MTTRARETRPVCRIVEDGDGREYVVEIRPTALLIRPIRTRRGGPAEKLRSFSQIYLDACAGGPLAARPRRKGHR